MLTIEQLFNREFYIETYPFVTELIESREYSNAFDHFIEAGQFEDLNPNPLFDTSYYRSVNPEVSSLIDEGLLTAASHFIEFGQFEGRNPHPLFDTQYYLQQNPDVLQGFQLGFINPFEHFILYGQFENRDPSPLFSTQFYLQKNPEILEQIEDETVSSIFEHYLRFGLPQGKLGIPPLPQDDLNLAVDVDTLLGSRFVVGEVNETDSADIYQFLIPNNASEVNLLLNQISANVDLEVIQDLNGNNAIDEDEILGSSSNLGVASETLSFDTLETGTYFIRISQIEGNTNYVLNLSATPL